MTPLLQFRLPSWVRALRANPGFTAVALLTLALGIGATTAVFSVVRGVLLRAPAYPQPDRIVVLRTAHLPELADFNASPGDFLGWRENLPSVEVLAASAAQDFVLTGPAEPRRLAGARATADLFSVYRLPPVLGRTFGPADDHPGAPAVAVISHAFWQQHFGAAPTVLGRTLQLDGRVHTIIGVMPPAFLSREPTAVWVPMAFSDDERSDNYRGARFLEVVGRLRPGTTLTSVQAELDLAAARLARQYPNFNAGWSVRATPLAAYAVREIRALLWLLLGAVGCVLAVACFNLAGLTLARGLARQRELAVRAALGATRAHLLRQLLAENLLLGLLGAAAGWLLAAWLLDALLALAPAAVLAAGHVTLDPGMLAFTVALGLGTGLLSSLLPAWQLSSLNLDAALRSQSAGATASAARIRFRRILTVAQLAVAIALIACTGLLVRSLLRLTSVDPGFVAAGAIAAQIDLPAARYPTAAGQQSFARQVLERVRTLPGVTAAAYAQALPLRGNWQIDFLLEGRPPAADGSQKVGYFSVSPEYFPAMGIPLLRGRAFTDRDTADAPPVAIVNQAFARRYFPNGDALGRRLYLMNGPWRLSEIVGIVADVKQTSLAQAAPPQAYEPFAQWSRPNFTLVVRSADQRNTVSLAALRDAVRAVDPQQPVTAVLPLDSLLARAVAGPRFIAALLTAFAVVAVAIATVGTFGLMMQLVTLRTREFGLRLALGASPAQLLRGVMGQGLRLVLLGGALGLVLAAAATPFLRSLLFETGPQDTAVLALVAAAIVLVALLACWLPARRATQVDPMITLRAE